MRLHSLFYALLGLKNIKVLGKHCQQKRLVKSDLNLLHELFM